MHHIYIVCGANQTVADKRKMHYAEASNSSEAYMFFINFLKMRNALRAGMLIDFLCIVCAIESRGIPTYGAGKAQHRYSTKMLHLWL